MDANELFARYREHVEGVIVAQVGLHREREFGEIGELFEIGWMHAGRVERFSVMRDIVIGVLERPGETPGLQRHDLVTRGAFGFVQLWAVTCCSGLHTRRSHHAFSPYRS